MDLRFERYVWGRLPCFADSLLISRRLKSSAMTTLGGVFLHSLVRDSRRASTD